MTRLLLLLALLIPVGTWHIPSLSAQSQVSYVQGQIRSGLPYNKPFSIKGSVIQGGQTANRIELTIYEETNRNVKRRLRNRKVREGKLGFEPYPYTTSSWDRQPNADKQLPDSFNLYVGRPLRIATRYRLVFQFYHKYTLGDQVTQTIVSKVREAVVLEAKAGAPIRVAEVNKALNRIVSDYASRKNFGYFKPNANGELEFVEGVRDSLKIPVIPGQQESTGLKIGLVAQEMANVARADNNLQEAKDAIDQIREDSMYTLTLEKLKKAAGDTELYTNTDLINLKRFAETYSYAKDPFPNISKVIGQGILSDKEEAVIIELYSSSSTLTETKKDLATAEERLATEESELGSSGLDGLIAEGFVRGRTSEVITMPQDSANSIQGTGANSIKIGTVYGVALAGLNLGPHLFGSNGLGVSEETVTIDMVSYLAAKFFLLPVDKRFDQAYFSNSPVSRVSIMAGSVIGGDLNHKGNSFGNPIGLKPLVGISYDFSRILSIEVGAIFFDEPSVSPFIDRNRLRAAPFFGLSIDADGFNRVKDIINGNKYREKPADQ